MRIAVFASGNGSNFSAIVEALRQGTLTRCAVALMVCDTPGAKVLERARSAGVEAALIPRREYPTREAFEKAVSARLAASQIDLIVLAGFMRLLSPEFVRSWKGRILNVHPSLLPAFKGTQSIRDAFEYGVKATGVTVHLVDEELDAGPIIAQGAVQIEETDTLDSLEAKIHALEHVLYPQAIQLWVDKKLRCEGRKVRIT